MKHESISTLSQGLLTHLRLSPSEAAVLVDDHRPKQRLLVFIYDKAAARRTKRVSEWHGLGVDFVEQAIEPHA
ncbi:hypothetical protein [Sphingomonas solaris]|uniref:Uncharacterized protein n=1 Tax=Alterirhizorhabdus solaris TaxID=2529389 RepID=A0A558R5N3_9SPHN|nr:hypothetical protein [Sphingomonas solaris]TVV74694.1 hypothetical protein FOY91_09005 [Sphingomonas solaris]